jgi:tetratricopeptide (TPR) repeat protein
MRLRLLSLFACSLVLFAESRSLPAQARNTRLGPVNRQHEELKTQADQAYRTGDFAKSIELTDRVLKADPNDDVALYLRGSARVELGTQQRNANLVREGVTDAREAIRIVNRVKIDYYLPYLYGMSQLAAIEGKPTHAETARSVATQLLAMDKVSVAEKANIAYQRALLNLQLQDSAAALADFDQATQFEPQHLGAHLSRCELLLQTGGPEQAEQAFAQAVERFPTVPMVFNNRGMFFQSQGRTAEAQADFSRAIELDGKFVPAYTNRAYSRLDAGRFTDALADLNTSVEIDPNQPAAYSLRGTAFLQTGDARSALTDYETALKLDPDSPQLRADVGFAQFFGGQHEAALSSFDSALEADPQARFLNPWRAAALLAAGRPADAERTFAEQIARPAAERDWFDVLTLLVLGKLTDNDALSAISGGDEQAARAQQCEAFYFIGQRRLFDGQREEAEPFFRQALDSNLPHLSAYRGAQFAVGEFGAPTE